jgi:hypothetical protein
MGELEDHHAGMDPGGSVCSVASSSSSSRSGTCVCTIAADVRTPRLFLNCMTPLLSIQPSLSFGSDCNDD